MGKDGESGAYLRLLLGTATKKDIARWQKDQKKLHDQEAEEEKGWC